MREFGMVLMTVVSLSGCASDGYHSSSAPSGYYYSDPQFCNNGPVCPVLIGAVIAGAAVALSH
jgi:hypothetical protein